MTFLLTVSDFIIPDALLHAQPDAFVRISLSSNNLEILASGLSIVKEKKKNMNYNLLINKGIIAD